MHRLTQNFECWITKDGEYFVVHNLQTNNADSGYRLGEYAEFEDNGVRYKVTISELDDIDLQIVNENSNLQG